MPAGIRLPKRKKPSKKPAASKVPSQPLPLRSQFDDDDVPRPRQKLEKTRTRSSVSVNVSNNIPRQPPESPRRSESSGDSGRKHSIFSRIIKSEKPSSNSRETLETLTQRMMTFSHPDVSKPRMIYNKGKLTEVTPEFMAELHRTYGPGPPNSIQQDTHINNGMAASSQTPASAPLQNTPAWLQRGNRRVQEHYLYVDSRQRAISPDGCPFGGHPSHKRMSKSESSPNMGSFLDWVSASNAGQQYTEPITKQRSAPTESSSSVDGVIPTPMTAPTPPAPPAPPQLETNMGINTQDIPSHLQASQPLQAHELVVPTWQQRSATSSVYSTTTGVEAEGNFKASSVSSLTKPTLDLQTAAQPTTGAMSPTHPLTRIVTTGSLSSKDGGVSPLGSISLYDEPSPPLFHLQSPHSSEFHSASISPDEYPRGLPSTLSFFTESDISRPVSPEAPEASDDHTLTATRQLEVPSRSVSPLPTMQQMRANLALDSPSPIHDGGFSNNYRHSAVSALSDYYDHDYGAHEVSPLDGDDGAPWRREELPDYKTSQQDTVRTKQLENERRAQELQALWAASNYQRS